MTAPATPAASTYSTGDRSRNKDAPSTAAKITQPQTSFMALRPSFKTALKISTHTHTRIPAKACCTQGRCAYRVMTSARAEMITRGGNTTPKVATMPPATPASFCPTKVAVFTAMTPGVHWPMAK